MSVKTMGLVWDLECPGTINGLDFKPNHKYVLIAYADHADHSGKNIFPAVETIARKTGYDPRSVQRLLRDLENMGVMVKDGMGPRGTNRYFIPQSKGGDKLSPLTNCQGDKNQNLLGDIPSGDIPSGDNLSPEFKNINPQNLYISISIESIWGDVKTKLQNDLPKGSFETWVKDTETVGVYKDHWMFVKCRNTYAVDWLTSRLQETVNDLSGHFVVFIPQAEYEANQEVIEFQTNAEANPT